jgi:hypothetical protein
MFVSRVAKACRAVPVTCVPARHGLLALADVPDRERRDGGPEPVIRRKDAVIPVPVLPRRRNEIREPVKKLKRRELDDAIGSWPRGLSAAARADPGGGLVPGEHVANASDAAACVVGYGQSLERKWRPGAVSQKVFQTQ